jgi:diadenosine tetraphosphate (Ap4A) HIT family hydrolase
MDCVFCQLPRERIIRESRLALFTRDAFPVSQGHSLIIPKRHFGSWFDATQQERAEIMSLLDEARQVIVREYAPQAFNIGINDGVAAGQTVTHLHVHLIPRYQNDVSDPRGGVRWVLPERAVYWEAK